ncbi:MAG: hypothetical protein JWR40_2717 [Massilia sp.]|jgi:hypothetical protein|nr:hypothetical protein [Massilia sp.]MDB5953390.1 hypothetical protein [Massilia sp.]
MILEPDISIAIVVSNDGNKRHSLLVRRRDDSKVMGSLHLDLGHIEREGFHALCQRVGYSAVYALARAHPETFAKYPLLLPPPLPHKDPHETATTLMYHAEREETGEYTRAIDALFRRYPDELAGLAELWDRVRQTLPVAE